MKNELLRCDNLVYRTGDFNVLDGVSLRLFAGEVLGLVGRSESGKTTLCRALAGEVEADGGTLYLKDRAAGSAALQREVALLYGDSRLIPGLSLGENLMIPPPFRKRRVFFSKRRLALVTKQLLDELEMDIPPDCKVEKLPQVQQHLLLMAKHVIGGKQAVLLHSTATEYTEAELEYFCDRLHYFSTNNVGILYVTSRWDAVLAQASRLSVIRNGRCVKTIWDGSQTDDFVRSYVHGYTGDVQSNTVGSRVNTHQAPVAVLGGLSLYKGQLVSVLDADGSAMELADQLLAHAKKQGVRAADMYHNSATREFIESMTVLDNLLLPISRKVSGPFGHTGRRVRAVLANECGEVLGFPGRTDAISLQSVPKMYRYRLLFYRWRQLRPDFYLMVNPTAECDLDERTLVHAQVNGLLGQGIPVIYISTSLEEVLQLHPHPLQLSGGRLRREVTA